MRRRVLWIGAAAVLGLVALVATLVAASPYRNRTGFEQPLIRESVVVGVSCASLFAYLGDSSHARDWSVFVDHITPLNAATVPDGARGSRRRSFRNADETGMRWDEYFTEVVPDRRRQLLIYGVQGVWLRARARLLTEQLYEPLGADRCGLSFTLFLEPDAGRADRLKLALVGYPIAVIFRSNIANVKKLNEAMAGGRAAEAEARP